VIRETYSPVCNIVDRLNRSRSELRKETFFYRSNVIIVVTIDIILYNWKNKEYTLLAHSDES